MTAADRQVLARADRDLLARILDETNVETSLPEPGWSEYLGELLRALVAWLAEPIHRLSGQAPWLQLAAWILLTALLAALVLLLTRAVRRNLNRRAPRPVLPPAVAVGADDEPRAARDREAWRNEIERRLTGGQVEAALEAVWWWLASSLLAEAVDPAWTSRELLVAADRRELQPLAAMLDRLVYGPARPSVPEVRGFVGRLEAVLR